MKFSAASLAFLASTANAVGQPGVPPLTLFPTYPPGHDPSDLVHLVPKHQNSLHYRENGKSGMYHRDDTMQKIRKREYNLIEDRKPSRISK